MKYEIIIDPQRQDLLICSPQRDRLLSRIEELIQSEESELLGYDGQTAVKLEMERVTCFYVQDGRVYARLEGKQLLTKLRLYQLEERFSSSFVKINQSCIVNLSRIQRFETSIGGSLMVTLEDGYRDYISRRQLKTVKERIGFK